MDYQERRKGFERQFCMFMKVWQSPSSSNTMLYSSERAQLWRSQSQLMLSQMDINVEQPTELIKEAYNLLDGLLSQETYTTENVHAAFSNPLVQFVISLTIQRLMANCWYTKPSMLVLYQESYLFFCKIIKRFWVLRDMNKYQSEGFLRYLGKSLHLRLKHWYMTEQLGYEYDREASKYRLYLPQLDLRYWTPKDSLTKDAGNHLMQEETEKEIVQYINGKNPVQARVAYLRLQGHQQQIIASECSIPLNTIKYHMKQVKKHTREWMTNIQKNII